MNYELFENFIFMNYPNYSLIHELVINIAYN